MDMSYRYRAFVEECTYGIPLVHYNLSLSLQVVTNCLPCNYKNIHILLQKKAEDILFRRN